MAIAVEAKSLSSVSLIAANPPARLSDHHQHEYEPLTLYITRVPGSKDVFLTPLKPRDRIVSAEDIQSALYYVHFNSVDDASLLTDVHQDERRQTATAIYTDAPPLPARPAPQLAPRPQQLKRKPLVQDSTTPSSTARLPSRPLPPLPNEVPFQQLNPYELSPSPVSPRDSAELEEAAGSLTLIRREPATGEQWNVATVQDALAIDVLGCNKSGLAKQIKRSGGPLDISISNSAYCYVNATITARGNTVIPTSFSRELRMPRALSTDESGQPDSLRDMKKRGYRFRSPWDHTCEFTTSVAGRNLVCRYLHPDQSTEDISELRFNLPSGSADLTARAQKRQSYVPANQRRSRMDVLRGVSRSEDVDTFDLDLSLGQEMAGGGFGGRQPKLGKLIIQPLGLAMLDLLVAANVGLWWRAWEKVS